MAKHLSQIQLTFARWLRSLRTVTRHNETSPSDITDEHMDNRLHTNICELFQLVEVHTNLKLKILEYVAPVYCNFHRLKNYFWLLPPECVDDVLRHPLLDRGSMDGVLETLFQWAKVGDHRQYLPALLSHLDLCSVSPSYLLRNETWLNQVPTPNLRLSTHSWLQVEVDYRLFQASNSTSDKKKDNNEQMMLKFYCQQESNSVSMLGYSTADKGLQVLKDIPVVLRNEMIAIGFDSYVYFLGGEGLRKVIKYNPATNSVISKGNLACPIYDAAVVQQNGIFYVVGKDLKSKPNYRLQSYNPATGQSEELASPNCCYHQPHLFILDDALHIVGSSKDSFLTIERYNPSGNAWITTNTTFSFSSPWHHAAVCHNKLYLCSKSVLSDENVWLVYDFESEKWADHPFRGGPSCVTGLWTIGNPDNATLLLQDEQSLLYTYEVMTSQWNVLPESIAADRSAYKSKHQVVQALYCGSIAETTRKQDLGTPDVTIACGNLEFVAHHSILSAASPCFHAMLSSQMEEAKTSKVEFPTITAETFERILEFVYTQKMSRKGMLSIENILLDLEAAHLMELSDLSAYCFSRLASNISLHNFEKLLKTALLYNNKGFKARILMYLAKNHHRFASSGIDLNMNGPLLKMILYHPELDALSLVKTLAASILESGKDFGKDGKPNLEMIERRFGDLLPAFEPMCSSCGQVFVNQNETQANIISAMQTTDHNDRCIQTPPGCCHYHQKLYTNSTNTYYPQYYILFYGTCQNKHHTNTCSAQRFYDDVTSEWIEDKKSFVKLDLKSPLADKFGAGYQQTASKIQTCNQQENAANSDRFSFLYTDPSCTNMEQASNLETVTEVPTCNQQDKITIPARFSLTCTDPACTNIEPEGDIEAITQVPTCNQQANVTNPELFSLACIDPSCTDTEQVDDIAAITQLPTCNQQGNVTNPELFSLACTNPSCTDTEQAGDVAAITQLPTCNQQGNVTNPELFSLACTDPSCTDLEQKGDVEAITQVPTCNQQANVTNPESFSLSCSNPSCTDIEQEGEVAAITQVPTCNQQANVTNPESFSLSCSDPSYTDIEQEGEVAAITQVPTCNQQANVTNPESFSLACTDPSCTELEQAGDLGTATEVATCHQQEKASISDESLSPDDKIYTDKEQERDQKITCGILSCLQTILSGWFSSPDEAVSSDYFLAHNQETGSCELLSWHQLDQTAISAQPSLEIGEVASTDIKQTRCQETICALPSQLLSASILLLNARKRQTCQWHRYFYVFQVNNQNLTKEIARWCVNSNKIISMTKLCTPVFLLGAEGLHGYIYIAGTTYSCDNIVVQRYCPLTGTCECLKTPDKLYKCTSSLSKSVFVSENYLYVISHADWHDVGHHLWRYNPVNDQWSVVLRHPDSHVLQQIINAWEKPPSR